MESSDNYFDALVARANDATGKNLLEEALNLWSLVREAKPSWETGYTSASRIHLQRKEFKLAEKICQLGLERCPSPNLGLLVLHSDIASSQKDFGAALSRLALVRKYFPHVDVGYRNAAFIYIALSEYDQADKICEEGIKKCKKTHRLFTVYRDIPLYKPVSEQDKFQERFLRQMNFCYNHPQLSAEKYQLANICKNLVQYNEGYRVLYNMIVQNIFSEYNGNAQKINNVSTTFPRLCFFHAHVKNLKYFIYVIKCFLPCMLDIVIENNDNEDKYISDFGITHYNIFYGKEYVKNYDYVILDGLLLHLSNDYHDLHNNIISLPHGSDCSPRINTCKYSKLVIISSKKQNGCSYAFDCSLFTPKTLSQYNNSTLNTCEIAYTGLYHISGFKNTHNLYENKKELFSNLKLDMDPNKPLCVLFEDELSNFGQIVYCCNKLANFINIIIKPHFSFKSPLLSKLDKRIHVYRNRMLAQNLLRYSADFILAGYYSGTFCSSVMLGLNVIPYYSRIVSCKGIPDKNYRYTYYIDDIKYYTNDPLKINLVHKFKIFDLLDINRLKKAILQDDYITWYKQNLASIQKDVFGDYATENAAEKTAEYILRFVRDKTLGEQCSSIYLK